MALKRRITFPKGLRDSGLHFTLFLALIGAATACAGKKAALAEPGVIGVPAEIDVAVANAKLKALGIEYDRLTDAQKAYLDSWEG